MTGLGTIVNVIVIIIGGLIGLMLKNGLRQRFCDIFSQACGLSVVFVGAAGAFELILSVHDGKLSSNHTLLVVFSFVIGGFIGELINIEKGLDAMGEKLRNIVRANGDHKFVEGFVTASLVFCVGAMSICGPIEEALTGDATTLYVKSILDGVMVIVFTSVYGVGAMFSALTVGIYQGIFTIFGVFIADFMSESLIAMISGIGSILIFGVGANVLWGKKIKVGNLLPALLVPAAYEAIKALISIV